MVMMLNTTLNNISVISWRSVLLVESKYAGKQDLFNLNLNLCEIFILLNDLDMTRFIWLSQEPLLERNYPKYLRFATDCRTTLFVTNGGSRNIVSIFCRLKDTSQSVHHICILSKSLFIIREDSNGLSS
jgi:hypothetical protein